MTLTDLEVQDLEELIAGTETAPVWFLQSIIQAHWEIYMTRAEPEEWLDTRATYALFLLADHDYNASAE